MSKIFITSIVGAIEQEKIYCRGVPYEKCWQHLTLQSTYSRIDKEKKLRLASIVKIPSIIKCNIVIIGGNFVLFKCQLCDRSKSKSKPTCIEHRRLCARFIFMTYQIVNGSSNSFSSSSSKYHSALYTSHRFTRSLTLLFGRMFIIRPLYLVEKSLSTHFDRPN